MLQPISKCKTNRQTFLGDPLALPIPNELMDLDFSAKPKISREGHSEWPTAYTKLIHTLTLTKHKYRCYRFLPPLPLPLFFFFLQSSLFVCLSLTHRPYHCKFKQAHAENISICLF